LVRFSWRFSALRDNGDTSDYFYVITDMFYKRSQQLSVKIDLSKKKELGVSRFDLDSKPACMDRIGRVSNDFQINLPKSFLINFKSSERNTIWQPNY
jgi:hypothetical protein